MYCRNCGQNRSDPTSPCPACGADPQSLRVYCGICGKLTDPVTGSCPHCGVGLPSPEPISRRASQKIPAGICGILLGSLGVHKFILGYTTAGLVMLLATLCTCGVAAIVTHVIGLIEGILYLTKTDEEFVRTYVDQKRDWF